MDYAQNLLIQVIKGFVNNPESVETFVSEDKDDKGTLTMINVKVHKDDVGTCIGEGGKTAEAIRKVIGIVGFKQSGTRIYVKIDAPKVPKTHFSYN